MHKDRNQQHQPHDITVYDGKLYFRADDGTTGNELYSYDPVADTTSLVMDIRPGSSGSAPNSLLVNGGVLYFGAGDGSQGNNTELWSYDGTTVQQVVNINFTESSSPNDMIAFDGKVFFTANDGISGRELWSYTDEDLCENIDNNLVPKLIQPHPKWIK